MSSSSLRKAIGVVKDQTSISIAKVASNLAPDLEVLIVKATSHDDDPTDEKYYREIISLTSSYSQGYVSACVIAVAKRLTKTRDWIVALKALVLVHRLLVDGNPCFLEEVAYATRRGMRVLNMNGFKDDAHANSWDHAGFVRVYALYLDEKVEVAMLENKSTNDGDTKSYDQNISDDYGNSRNNGDNNSYDYNDYGKSRKDGDSKSYVYNGKRDFDYGNGRFDDCDGRKDVGRLNNGVDLKKKDLRPERVLGRLNRLLRVLDRVLGCKPMGMAKNSRLVLVSLYLVLKESFDMYSEISEALGVLFDKFSEMEYSDCVWAFDLYFSAAKMIDDLIGFYNWCKDVGIARSSEYPEVKRVGDEVLSTLEGLLKEKANNRPNNKSPERIEREAQVKEEKLEVDMNEIKALPPPEDYTPPAVEPQVKLQPQGVTEDLVNLRDDGVSADEQGNKLALALFSGPAIANSNSAWEAFPSNGEVEVTSAWQTPAAESGKADWELALVESASNLSRQKAALAGGFDPLLLNGMYDQGAVRQHVSTTQLNGGSASSVALPSQGKSTTPVLALPAPDGSMQPVANQDPFAASLAVPPPSYVQIADMERKQNLLVQEQHLWQQYGRNGMQGQVGLANISGVSGFYGSAHQPTMMPYGMPQFSGMGQPGGYYAPH